MQEVDDLRCYVYRFCCIIVVTKQTYGYFLSFGYVQHSRLVLYIVTLQISCLTVCLFVQGLGRPVNESVAWQLARMDGSS